MRAQTGRKARDAARYVAWRRAHLQMVLGVWSSERRALVDAGAAYPLRGVEIVAAVFVFEFLRRPRGRRLLSGGPVLKPQTSNANEILMLGLPDS